MDISNYQNKIDLSVGTYDFAIIKATEGIGFVDKSFNKFAVQLTELNKLIGCYHFARPDLNGTISGMEREANHFWNTVKNAGLENNAILVLDWETEPMDSPTLIEAWTTEIEELTGRKPFIYGSRSKLKNWMGYKAVKENPIWVAVWPNTTKYEVGTDPGLLKPADSIVPWKIWQYSSTGRYPNFSGNIDLDYCKMNKEEWLSMAGYKAPEKEIISEDMKWAIDAGLFHGYKDGKFHPQDPLTREQAASVLRRYTRYIGMDRYADADNSEY